MSLNPSQAEAVAHRGGPLLVLAGAGTGKTRVIVHRVVALLDEGVPPWAILAVTFTNKAAAEMRGRIAATCEDRHDVREMWIGTFHAICARILRRHGESVGLPPGFAIYDPDDSAKIMVRTLEELRISERMLSVRGALSLIDRAKNLGLDPDHFDRLGLEEPIATLARRAYARYERRLRAAGAVDFGGLLLEAVRLLRSAGRGGGQLADLDPTARLRTRFRHVVVDEFQDTNPVQGELVDLLCGRAELCVVGDDDQSIYGWRGADVDQILGFAGRHEGTKLVRLEQNYRSTGHILRCADAVIARNRGRLGKTLWSELGDGSPVRLVQLEDERQEARWVAREIRSYVDDGGSPEDCAIFYRTHAQSRALEHELRQAELACRIVGGVAFYARQEVKDLLAWLTILRNPHSDAHLLRAMGRPSRGIGKTSQERIEQAASLAGVSTWAALQGAAGDLGLSKGAAGRLAAFVELVAELAALLGVVPLDELAERVLERIGYREMLAGDDPDEAQGRLENLQEFVGNLAEFVESEPNGELETFLQRVSLATSEDQRADARAVTLMTVHSAKGLEFDRVYLTGMEERVFPHARVLDDPTQLEEERRLAYVAMTRARRELAVTHVRRRFLWGQTQPGTPSRFLADLPPGAVSGPPRSRPAAARTPAQVRPTDARWDRDIVYDDGSAPELDATELVDAGAGDGTALWVGMTVRHAQFGQAELLGWSGMGRDLKLHLRFRAGGTKTILARFCEL